MFNHLSTVRGVTWIFGSVSVFWKPLIFLFTHRSFMFMVFSQLCFNIWSPFVGAVCYFVPAFAADGEVFTVNLDEKFDVF